MLDTVQSILNTLTKLVDKPNFVPALQNLCVLIALVTILVLVMR